MNILAIETSCDETAVAVIRDGRHIVANVISSQIKLHQQYGGVVPELASREHIVNIVPVLNTALARAGLSWDEIDAIAVTRGPGLAGALLVGVNTGKALAFALEKPFVGVNHLEGHIYSNWLIPEDQELPPILRPAAPAAAAPPAPAPSAEELPWQGRRLVGYSPGAAAPPTAPAAAPHQPPAPNPQPLTEPTDPQFPLICLVVSGGHTELLYMTGHGEYQMLGRTIDDAAGEAFDKVARILGLGYPGGPAIQRAAEGGNPAAFDFPHAVMRGTFDFSFSGLKTAVLRKVNEFGPPQAEAPPAPAPAPAPAAAPAAPAAAAPPPAAEPATPAPTPAAARPAAPAVEPATESATPQAEEPTRPPVRMLGGTAAPPPTAPPATEEAEEGEEALPLAPAPPATPARRPPSSPAAEPPAPRAASVPPAPPTPPAARPTPPRPEPPTPVEPDRPAPTRRPGPAATGPGLIRVESERPTAQPLPTPTPPEPIPPAPARREPRVLGTEGEQPPGPDPELPAFLQRGTPPPRPTSIRSRQRPAEPEVPAFLRERGGTSPPAPEEAERPASPAAPRPTAPRGPVTPPSTATPAGTGRGADAPPRSAPSRAATPPTPPRREPAPPPAAERPAPRSTTPPARPAARPPEEDEEIPLRPAPRSQPSAPRAPLRPAPKPQPLAEREIRPIPKSVQAGRPTDDEDEDIDLDDDDSLATPRRPGANPLWSDWLEDMSEGEGDDEPPPRRSPVPLEGPRRPEASVRLPGSGKPATPPADKPPLPVADIAASFQEAAVDILVEKTVLAVATYRARAVLMAGGVAANRLLRERLRERLGPDIDLRYPPLIFCTDNAAMIAAAAYFRYDAGLQTDWSLDIDPNARYWE